MNWKTLSLLMVAVLNTQAHGAHRDQRRCGQVLGESEIVIAADAGTYRVNGEKAPQRGFGWRRYLDQVVDVEYYGAYPSFVPIGTARQKAVSEGSVSANARRMANEISHQRVEYGFWEGHTKKGRKLYSSVFTSGHPYQLEVDDSTQALYKMVRENRISLSDLKQINLFHNHPDRDGVNAPLSIGDRRTIFYFEKMIDHDIKVGIYAVHPDALGILFYSDTGI